ncbi:MAG: hypothetical protein MJY65_06115, partial [Bacteroidaceae bacterium]|nr:hypothetical protein [Bacteroidaceae bacterium]
LFEFAMHEKQYREFKSGQAKAQFNKDLLERMEKAQAGTSGTPVKHLTAADKRAILHPDADALEAPAGGRVMWELDYNEGSAAPAFGRKYREGEVIAYLQTSHGIESIAAPMDCRIAGIDAEQGSMIAKGQPLAWIEKAQVEPQAQPAAKAAKAADSEVIPSAESKWKDSMNVNK